MKRPVHSPVIGIVKAWKADERGTLAWRGTARSFNPDCARAGKIGIAEVEEVVPVGTLSPEEIHLPGIYVQRVVKGSGYEKRIEKETLSTSEGGIKVDKRRELIIRRAARELKDGMYVNLGFGMPTLVSIDKRAASAQDLRQPGRTCCARRWRSAPSSTTPGTRASP